MKSISVLLVEDYVIVREGVRSLLEQETDIEVVGESETGPLAMGLATKLRPDVIVMEISLPLFAGAEAIRQILLVVPATKVLILSTHSDEICVQQAIIAGAAGYLVKQTPARVLPQAIREVYQGTNFFSPCISTRLYEDKKLLDRNGLQKKIPKLTAREMEVLQLVAEGNGNKQTAAELGISAKTVEKHRQSLGEKLKIQGTANLTRYAMELGILQTSVV